MQPRASTESCGAAQFGKVLRIFLSLKLCAFVISIFFPYLLKAEAQDLLPISIQVGSYGGDDSVGKIILEIKNNTTTELSIPTNYLLDGRIMLSVEDPKAKKGLQTSVSFFTSKIANSPFGSFEVQPNETLRKSFRIAPNSAVRFKLDISKQLERIRRTFPDEPINLSIDFTQSFSNMQELKEIVGLKVRSPKFMFEKAILPAK